MQARQPRLIPDHQPIVDRLGPSFFQSIPTQSGVYFLRDAHLRILYVGKAVNLRRRLSQYRVANADRFPRRLLRMLHQVHRIDWELWPDERSALTREKELIFSLKPSFNRAGTWRGNPRFLSWNFHPHGLHMELTSQEPGPNLAIGPSGSQLVSTHAALARLLWVCWNPNRGYTGLPHSWIRNPLPPSVFLHGPTLSQETLNACIAYLQTFAHDNPEPLLQWIREQLAPVSNPFEISAARADLEALNG